MPIRVVDQARGAGVVKAIRSSMPWTGVLVSLVCASSAYAADPELVPLPVPAPMAKGSGVGSGVGSGLAPVPNAVALSLRELLEGVRNNNPGLQASKMQSQAAREDTKAVERLRWPTLSATVESNSSSSNSAYSPTKALNLEQTLWDFGRISARVAESEAVAKVTETQSDLTREDLFLQVVAAWQQLMGSLERQRVALKTLELLQGYQEQMERRVQAQASPKIDLELVNARVLQTEVELTTARTQIAQAALRLEQLSGLKDVLGRTRSVEPLPSASEIDAFAKRLDATDWEQIANNYITVEKVRQEREILEQRLSAKQAEMMPQLYFRLVQPLEKSSSVSSTSPGYFIGLRYTPSPGFAIGAEAQALQTRLEGQALSEEAARREMLQTLLNDREEFLNARARLQGLEKSVEGSAVVSASYLRQFQAGRKSWLDLLNTARELAQNEYSQADARVALVGAMYRLQLRTSSE